MWMLLATPSPIRSGMTMMLAKLNGRSSAAEAATVHSAATPSGASTRSTSESRRRSERDDEADRDDGVGDRFGEGAQDRLARAGHAGRRAGRRRRHGLHRFGERSHRPRRADVRRPARHAEPNPAVRRHPVLAQLRRNVVDGDRLGDGELRLKIGDDRRHLARQRLAELVQRRRLGAALLLEPRERSGERFARRR